MPVGYFVVSISHPKDEIRIESRFEYENQNSRQRLILWMKESQMNS